MLDLSFYVDDFSVDGGEALVLKKYSDFFFLILKHTFAGKETDLGRVFHADSFWSLSMQQ